MSQKPSIPKGTRDFGQQSMAERNYIFETIKKVFRTFGYAQIETPAMENLSTLLGKYGEEGDKLLFRVLNSGDCFSKVNLEDYCKDGCVNSVALSKEVCEKGLRYDLTVPFARLWCSTRARSLSRTSVSRSSLSGGPTGRRKGVTVSSTSAMWT